MTARPKDLQRSRVYKAEHSVTYPITDKGQRHFSNTRYERNIDQCQQYVDSVLAQTWLLRRFGERSIKVEATNGYGANASRGNRIRVSRHMRDEHTMLHEIAHCLTHKSAFIFNVEQHAGHGPEYVGIMLFLVAHVMGKEVATELRAAYAANRVKYTNKAIPPYNTLVPTKAQAARATKAKYTKRLAEARAATKQPVPRPTALDLAKQLRQMAAAGQFGAAGAADRRAALRTALAIERKM